MAALALAAVAAPAAAHGTNAKPEVLPLPEFAQLRQTAPVWWCLIRVNVKTGQAALLAEGAPGRAAIGIKVAFGKVFVAGGPTGKVRIQSAADGSVLREEQAGTVGSTFVNDVALGGRAAYFTDSRSPAASSCSTRSRTT